MGGGGSYNTIAIYCSLSLKYNTITIITITNNDLKSLLPPTDTEVRLIINKTS